jgi:hypothetical protein
MNTTLLIFKVLLHIIVGVFASCRPDPDRIKPHTDNKYLIAN